MLQQQHIQAIIKNGVKELKVTLRLLLFCFVFDKMCFIFLFLIYFSLLFIRVGVGTCFPISFYRNF